MCLDYQYPLQVLKFFCPLNCFPLLWKQDTKEKLRAREKNYQNPILTDCGILARWRKCVLLQYKKQRLLCHSLFRVIIFNQKAASIEGRNSNLKTNLREIFVIVSQIACWKFIVSKSIYLSYLYITYNIQSSYFLTYNLKQ